MSPNAEVSQSGTQSCERLGCGFACYPDHRIAYKNLDHLPRHPLTAKRQSIRAGGGGLQTGANTGKHCNLLLGHCGSSNLIATASRGSECLYRRIDGTTGSESLLPGIGEAMEMQLLSKPYEPMLWGIKPAVLVKHLISEGWELEHEAPPTHTMLGDGPAVRYRDPEAIKKDPDSRSRVDILLGTLYVQAGMVGHALRRLVGIDGIRVDAEHDKAILEHYRHLQYASMADVRGCKAYRELRPSSQACVLPFFPACDWESGRPRSTDHCVGYHAWRYKHGLPIRGSDGSEPWCDSYTARFKVKSLQLSMCEQCHHVNVTVWTPVLYARHASHERSAQRDSQPHW